MGVVTAARDELGAVRGVIQCRHFAARVVAHHERRVTLRDAVDEIHAANVAARNSAQKKM